MDYVKNFKKHFNIDFDGSKYDIHHIDLNRENNEIDNLLLLPKELHSKYHIYLNEMNINATFEYKIKSMLEIGQSYNQKILEDSKNFVEIQAECNKWADYKEYLLGYIPNVHELEVR